MGLIENIEIGHFTLKEIPPPAGVYSHGVVANGFLFTCGVGPANARTGIIEEEGIVEQTQQVFKNLSEILRAKNVDFSRVVKLTAYLQNLNEDFAAYDSVCREFLTPPYPARTTTGAQLANFLVEIDCIVAL